MGRIGVATSLRRESGPTSSALFVTNQQAEPPYEETANERGAIRVCILGRDDLMASDQVVRPRAPGQEAASTHRKGDTGEALGPGEILAMAPHPLV
jgi:hypothetical protein